MIRVEHIEVAYGRGRPVLEIERLDVEPGERVAIIGPSGAGKSTLLRCLKGYVAARRGKVEVLGVNLAYARRRQRRAVKQRVALIYQQFHLVPRLGVLDNALCGRLGRAGRWRSLLGWFGAADIRAAWSAIVEVGLADEVHRRADTLSGGERQRLAVARALAQEPELILCDEPVSSLDPAWAADVLALLADVQARHRATLVMTLHQPELARRFAGRVIGLRAGRIAWDGPSRELTEDALEAIYGSDRDNLIAFPRNATA